ncbi:cyclic GMP-AMP synthase-like receptor 1 [Argopecten irradians]|uniref:cyclic GMP-AMP synthase-like receptor 1 n=1 Tax=Argopecten irradians TaxID=31199 RepID=UPI0037154AEF
MFNMEFTDQRESSKRMSRHLDHMEAVGPAETVNIRRLMHYLVYGSRNHQLEIFPTGSNAEEFNFDTSDTDLMLVFQNSIVIQEHERFPDGDKTVFVMDKADCRPGFTLLKPLHLRLNEQRDITNAHVHFRNSCYLSSVVLVSNTMFSGARLHGPCSMRICSCSKRHETDFAFSFHCLSWPDDLSDFRSRTKYSIWPEHLVNRIIQGDCHFVAIGDKHSDLFGMQWRISFAKAEKCLVMSFNHVQFKTYALLKTFLKQVIERDTSIKDSLCSYFMKIIVFHAIEHCESSMWVDENVLNCFRFCFTILIEFVNTVYFPNYFILTNNMFLSKVFGRSRRKLLFVLSRYQRMGLTCLSLCPSLGGTLYCPTDDNRHALVVEYHLDSYVHQKMCS